MGMRFSLLEGKHYLQNLLSSGRLTTWFLAFTQYSSYYLLYALITTQFNERYCEVCNESSSLTSLAKACRERPNSSVLFDSQILPKVNSFCNLIVSAYI